MGWPGAGAQAEFEAVLARDPGDMVALNNRALCRMYACDLTGAIQARVCPGSDDVYPILTLTLLCS